MVDRTISLKGTINTLKKVSRFLELQIAKPDVVERKVDYIRAMEKIDEALEILKPYTRKEIQND